MKIPSFLGMIYHYITKRKIAVREQTPEEILANMRTLKKWIQARMYEFDNVIKMKKDLEYYQHQTAQLMVRVERLERELLKGSQTQPEQQ